MLHSTHLTRARLHTLSLVVALLFAAIGGTARATSFSTPHDTVTFSTTSGTSTNFTVYIQHLTTNGITVTGSIYGGNSSLFHAGDPVHISDTVQYAMFHGSFLSSASGTYSTTLILRDSVNSTVKYVTLIASVSGNTSYPNLHLYASGGFLQTTVNTTVCRSVALFAAIDTGGGHSLVITNVQLTSTSSAWSLSLGGLSLPATLLPHHSDSVTICFDPTQAGDYLDSLKVTYTDLDGTSKVVSLALPGSAIAVNTTPVLHAYLSGNFSNTPIGTTKCNSILVYAAIDTGSLTLNSITLTQSGSAWSISYPFTLPLMLSHGMLDTVTVCYHPTSSTDTAGSIVFNYTHNGETHSLEVHLSGNTVVEHHCITITGDTGLAFGALAPGHTQTRTYHLVNPNSDPWIVRSVTSQCDTSIWVLAGLTLPDTLAPNASAAFTVTFKAPTTASNNVRYACSYSFGARDSGSDCTRTWEVRGYASSDSSHINLNHDSTQSIHFDGSRSGLTTKYIVVQNNTGNTVRITGLALTNTSSFTLSLVSPDSTVPFHLANGSSMVLKLVLTDTTPGAHHDTLVISDDNHLAALEIPIEADVASLGVAQPVQALVRTLSISPNPSHGAITVQFDGMRNVTVQVLDLLGRVVMEARDLNSTWRWNGLTLNGQGASAGIYIVRATGVMPTGQQAIASARVSIVR